MILYYAFGGGLGHLTRARAFFHTRGIRDRAVILTASHFATDPRIVGDAGIITVPADLAEDIPRYRQWLCETIDRVCPDEIYIDSFPAGILGEFCDFPFPEHTALYHLARLLRWSEYSRTIRGAPPSFRLTYELEPLANEHQQFLRDHSAKITPLALRNPTSNRESEAGEITEQLACVGNPVWVIVHSGPDEEIAELIAYADEMSGLEKIEPAFILVAPARPMEMPSHIKHLDFYPASALFPFADRIITACGFNVMRETEEFKEKHRFLPLARRYDDQFLRAARRKKIER